MLAQFPSSAELSLQRSAPAVLVLLCSILLSPPPLTLCCSNAVFPSQCLVSIVAESRNKLVFGWVKLNICVTCQHYQVVATETVNPVALEANIDCAIATEKLDGTCCYVTMFEGNLFLYSFCYNLFPKKHCNQQAKYFWISLLLQFPERVCVVSL